ncbi:MAG: efflux transporter periplasmic adaptor subunit [Cellvibrionaceae bacterium]|nr:efflux transporter periplasmic adaptor subunit [Cellvibrionaceae bacterium]|tara:strand:- start:2179 stop:3468 length:1290 start_codon:yes stop_codon:yes gene_type:complete
MMNTQRFRDYLDYIWSNKNYRLSLYLGTATLIWLGSGLIGSEPESKEVAAPAEIAKMRVQARYIEARDYQPSIRVRARTQANRHVSIRAEISGRVVALLAKEGQAVKRGEVICELALEDRQLRLRETKSAVEQAQMEYDGALRLKSGGYQSATAIAGAKSRLDSAKANLLRSEIDLANVKIRAPFSGVVDSHSVDVGDFMDRGDECGVVMDLNPIIVRGRVSETEVGHIEIGSEASGALLTGQKVAGEVTLVGYASDEVTRSFPVEVSVDNPDLNLRSGITTDIVIPTHRVMAHVISPSLLSLDDAGGLGVRTLKDNHQVEFVRIELIGDHEQGVWVSGLTERALVITQGQEYVSDGELVEAVVVNPPMEQVAEEILAPKIDANAVLQNADRPDSEVTESAVTQPVAADRDASAAKVETVVNTVETADL